MIVLALLANLVNDSSAASDLPKDPPAAIAAADAHPERDVPGVYRMKVVAASRGVQAVYLNSSEDYRAPDDVTFHLTLRAAKTLEARIGGKPDVVLIDRTVIARAPIRAIPIVNMVAGRPSTLNRYQHTVLIRDASTLTIE